MTKNVIRLPRRTRSSLSPFNKNFRNDDRDGEGIRRWRSVNDNGAEDNANNDNVG